MNSYDTLLGHFFSLIDHELLRLKAREVGSTRGDAHHQLERTRCLFVIRWLRSEDVVFDLRVYLENTAARATELAGNVDALGSLFEDALRLIDYLDCLRTRLPELVQELECLGLDEWLDLSVDLDFLHESVHQFFQLLANLILQERDIQFKNVEIAYKLGRLLGLELPEVLRGFFEDVTRAATAIQYDLSHLDRQ